jgi:SAM-dependent methyltransferase
MNLEEYRFLFELEEHHWWFVGMRKIVAALLDPFIMPGPARILDAGCGAGFMLLWLKRYCHDGDVVGLDISSEALQFARQRGQKSLVRDSVTDLAFPAETFDLIVSLDVLDECSLEGTASAFSELARVLKTGGILLVRLPAFQCLYSAHDRAIHTMHRYRADELARCLVSQGLILERLTYANTFLFLVAAIWRWLCRARTEQPRSDVRPLPRSLRWMNPLLIQLLALEAAWLRHSRWKLPFGLSVIAVARKTAGGQWTPQQRVAGIGVG